MKRCQGRAEMNVVSCEKPERKEQIIRSEDDPEKRTTVVRHTHGGEDATVGSEMGGGVVVKGRGSVSGGWATIARCTHSSTPLCDPEPEAKLTNDLCPRRPDERELRDERGEKKLARGDASNTGVAPWTLA